MTSRIIAPNIGFVGHKDPTHQGGEAPPMAHMAFHYANQSATDLIPIPEGAHLFFIEDPRYAGSIIEVILQKVVYENHIFKGVRGVAYSKDWKSTRKLFLTPAWEGEYRSAVNTALDQTHAHMEGKKPK